MQITKQFVKKYLLPLLVSILLIIGQVIIAAVFRGTGPDILNYAIFAAGILIIALLFILLRTIVIDEGSKHVAAEKIETAEEKYRALLETSGEGTLVVLENQIVYANFESWQCAGLP